MVQCSNDAKEQAVQISPLEDAASELDVARPARNATHHRRGLKATAAQREFGVESRATHAKLRLEPGPVEAGATRRTAHAHQKEGRHLWVV